MPLSGEERASLAGIARGATNLDLATSLNVSEWTVRRRIDAVYPSRISSIACTPPSGPESTASAIRAIAEMVAAVSANSCMAELPRPGHEG